jgi:hypothetical protein
VRDGAKVVVVERRELVRVVALNIFKGWRAFQVRGSRICPTNETSVQLAGWLFRRRPKAGREAAGSAELQCLCLLLQAGWLAGERVHEAGDSSAIKPWHLIWRMLSEHVHTRPSASSGHVSSKEGWFSWS